jgi:hypothetical protein
MKIPTAFLLLTMVCTLSNAYAIDHLMPGDEGGGGGEVVEKPEHGTKPEIIDKPATTQKPTDELVRWHEQVTNDRIKQIQEDSMTSASQKDAAIQGLKRNHEACIGDASHCK